MSEKLLAVIIGENIVSQRKKLKLSQKELAAKLGISYESMGRMEHGKMFPKMGRLQELAHHLQCSVASLFQNPSDETNERAKVLAELLEPLSPNSQEAVMTVVYATVHAIKTKE